MKIAQISLFVFVMILVGCSQKISNPFEETRKASYEYSNVGSIDKNAPIITEKKKEEIQPSQEIEQKKYQDQLDDEYEKVGYITNIQTDQSSGLYVYTFTNALRTDQIQFYSKTKLPYSERDLIRVYVKDNFVYKHEPYKAITGKRKKSFIQAAKEYIINL